MSGVSKDFEYKGSVGASNISGVILAGGKSHRFGRNKALEEVNGIPLIQRVIEVLESLFPYVLLSTNSPDEYAHLKLPMHADLVKGLGPLGGIYTALTLMPGEAGFFVACDMPRLSPGLIQYMLDIRSDFDVVIPRISDKMEPLHALYTKRCLPPINRMIESRVYQIFRFFDEVPVRYVDEDEIRRFDPNLRSFFNINSPRDLERLQQLK
jgi:molybdopterin-guanine dinucleotide biosynthesis protein A